MRSGYLVHMDISSARDMALNDLGAEEYDHFGKPAYRIPPKRPGGKPGRTFMTLWIEEGHAVLMLDVEQQAALIAEQAAALEPHPSKWGSKGATIAHLGRMNERMLRHALEVAHAYARR
jgi:hypothetical protein